MGHDAITDLGGWVTTPLHDSGLWNKVKNAKFHLGNEREFDRKHMYIREIYWAPGTLLVSSGVPDFLLSGAATPSERTVENQNGVWRRQTDFLRLNAARQRFPYF